MVSSFGELRQRLFRISPEEATFTCRGFSSVNAAVRLHLEHIGQTFIEGYHAALVADRQDALSKRLDGVELCYRGFAFEGAGMALALLDCLTFWRKNRLQTFLEDGGAAHCYMVHVGAGWALARIPFLLSSYVERLDPLLRWLAIDGYGFHQGYFRWREFAGGQPAPKTMTGYAQRAFDQGLGRSLWFIHGADVDRISKSIFAFRQSRQADLWSGVGLACAYAGGVESAAIKGLQRASGDNCPHLAQGAAFAAKTRQRAGNQTSHTTLACEVFCGLSAEEAAQLTDLALVNLPADGAEPAYEIWRQRIRNYFRKDGAHAHTI